MQQSHTFLAKFFHWGFIVLYAYGIFKQIDDISQLEDTGLLVFEVIFASIFLMIVMIRYFYMSRFETFLGAREPIPAAHKYLAKIIHRSMYLCLVLLPLSGLLIAGLYARNITEGLMQDIALAVHELSASISYLLIAIHISAALYSRIKGEGVWTSMVPLWKEKDISSNKIVNKISKIESSLFKKIESMFSWSK